MCPSLPISCCGKLSAAFSGSLDEWTSSGTDNDPDQRTSQRGHPNGVRGREGNRTGACNEPQEVEFILSHTGYKNMWQCNCPFNQYLLNTLYIPGRVPDFGLGAGNRNNKLCPDFFPRERIRDVTSFGPDLMSTVCVCEKQNSTWIAGLGWDRTPLEARSLPQLLATVFFKTERASC